MLVQKVVLGPAVTYKRKMRIRKKTGSRIRCRRKPKKKRVEEEYVRERAK
jgi:hypothetical protein